jgi:hypothetical protein
MVALAPLLLLAPAACGSGVLTAGKVADGAEDALEKKVGVRPDVTCPGDLDAKVGATGRCTLTAPGDDTTYGLTVTITKVDGDDAAFDVEVDSAPKS